MKPFEPRYQHSAYQHVSPARLLVSSARLAISHIAMLCIATMTDGFNKMSAAGDCKIVSGSLILFGLCLVLMLLSISTQFHMDKTVSSQALRPHRSRTLSYKSRQRKFMLTYPGISPNETQDLLDFAVAGFSKCGTTFLMRDVLGSSDHVYMGYRDKMGQYKEMHQLQSNGKLAQFMSYFQSHPSPSSTLKRGFKAPNTLMFDQSLMHLSTYFPKTKFIVSVRHPILWFQSNYNYKMRLNKYANDFKITPHNRIGECKAAITNLNGCTARQTCVAYKPGFGCTDISNFHIHLSRMGWTLRNSARELELLHKRLETTFDFSQSQMFLIELNQLDARKNSSQTDALVRDLESFLGMDPGSLSQIQPPEDTGTSKHEKKAQGKTHVLQRMINICNEEYSDLRNILLQQGQDASEWIQEFFLASPHVVVSNREYMIHLLEQWKKDPCDNITQSL